MTIVVLVLVVLGCAWCLCKAASDADDEWHLDDPDYEDSPLWRTRR